MTQANLREAVLDMLFSFAQADRAGDVRLIARLLLVTRRDVVEVVQGLRREGLVEGTDGHLTTAGIEAAAMLRQSGFVPSRAFACAA